MDFSELLSIFAAFILLVGYVFYYKKISSGKTQPNIASWLLWVFIIILNAVSYGIMTGDSVKAYLTIASSFAAVAVLVNTVRHGTFKRLDKIDIAALLVGVVAALSWLLFQSATYGNLIFQIAIFIAFIPTLHSAWQDPRREPSFPWLLWGAAYAVSLVVVFLRWQGQPQDFVYPVQGIILHTLVGVLALRVGRKSLKEQKI